MTATGPGGRPLRPLADDDPRHGTNAGHGAHYSAGTVPCDPCKAAHATYKRNLWRRKYLARLDSLMVDATGTARRIRALQAIGWPLYHLDRALGHGDGNPRTSNYVHNLCHRERVRASTAAKVARIYDQLSGTPGPSERVRNLARKRGWAPPLAWDDIDDPDEAPVGWKPDGYRRNRADLLAEAEWLLSQGESFEQAAKALGLGPDGLRKAYEREKKEAA